MSGRPSRIPALSASQDDSKDPRFGAIAKSSMGDSYNCVRTHFALRCAIIGPIDDSRHGPGIGARLRIRGSP
jgi:hypothetical protein